MLGKRFISQLAASMLMLVTVFPALAIRQPSQSAGAQFDQLKAYHDSGKYSQDIQQKIEEAKEYLERQLQYPRNTQLAIVLDVDETAISNYESLERMHFTSNTQALTAAFMLNDVKPIDPVLSLYQFATNNNVAVFFLSSRPNTPEMLALTIKHLKSAGFEQWKELLLMPVDKSVKSISEFKTASRRHITAQGYDIILNIGDQDADLVGGYAEVKVRIPNPFYT